MKCSLRALAALGVAFAIVGGCSSSVEVDRVTSTTKEPPRWVTEGLALARAESAEALERADLPEAPALQPSPTEAGSSLMPEPQFIAALGALGLDPTAASCIYQGIVGTPLADSVGQLLSVASDPIAAATAGANATSI